MPVDPTDQLIYDELNRRGAFRDPTNAAIGHELRARGVVVDSTQGGAVRPASSDPGGSSHDPYGDPADHPARLSKDPGGSSHDPYGDPADALPVRPAPARPLHIPVFTSHTPAPPAFTSHRPASPAPAQPNPVARFFKSIPQDAVDGVKDLAMLPAFLGKSLAQASYLQNADTTATLQGALGQKAAADQTRQTAAKTQADLSQTVGGFIPGTAKDIAAGRAKDIPGNYLRELTQHPLNFALNTAGVASLGAGGLLARAGAMERGAAAAARAGDAAQAASLAAKAARLRVAGKAIDDAASGRSAVRGVVRGAGKLRRPVAVPAKPITTPAALPATMPAEAPASPVQAPTSAPDESAVLAHLEGKTAHLPASTVAAPQVRTPANISAPAVKGLPTISAPAVKSLDTSRLPARPVFTPQGRPAELPVAPLVPAESVPTPKERVVAEKHVTTGTGTKFTPTANDKKAPGVKVDPKTGMTPAQKTYLQNALESYVHMPEAHFPEELTPEQLAHNTQLGDARSAMTRQHQINNKAVTDTANPNPATAQEYEQSRSVNKQLQDLNAAHRRDYDALGNYHTREMAAHVIQVPGDGKYTVRGIEQANALHVNLTGKGLVQTKSLGTGETLPHPVDYNAQFKHTPSPFTEPGGGTDTIHGGNHARSANGEIADPGIPDMTVTAKNKAAVLAKYATDEPFPESSPATRIAGKLDAAAETVAARIKSKTRGQVNMGADPTVYADLVQYGALKIAKGAVTSADWGKEMVGTFGEQIRPHLASLWDAAHEHLTTLRSASAAGQDLDTAGSQHLASLPAPAVSQAATPAPPAPPAPKAAHTGNVNTARMAIGGDAKEAIAEHMRILLVANPDHLAPRSNADTLAAAKALRLTPEMLEPFAHDAIPDGVPDEVFRTAVRDLTAKAATAETSAADTYKAVPTPENEAALRQANKAASDLTARASALSLKAGRAVQSGNISVDGLESALHDAAGKAADLSQVPRLADPPPSFTTQKVPRPRSAGYGAKNKVVTTEAYQQALKDLGSLGTRVNSGIDPALFKPAVTIGAYHLEAGARQFGAWAGQMKTHFPQASDTDLQRVYAAARAQVVAGTQKAASAAQRTAYAPVLADSLTPRMGRQGVSDFMNALPDTVLDKLIHGGQMTEAERRVLAETHDAHLLPGKPKPPVNETLKTLRRAVGDAKAGRLGYASAKAAVQGELRKLAPAEKQGDIAVGLAKLPDGDFHALANFFNKSAAGNLFTVMNHKHLLQASLLSSPKTLLAIALSHIGSTLFEDGPVRAAANALDPLLGKISGIKGPNTIQPFNAGASARAVKVGLSEMKPALRILRDGPTSQQFRGYDTGRSFEHGTHQEFTAVSKYKPVDKVLQHFINPIVRYPGRTHAALYHFIGEAVEARGLEEGAYLKAKEKGGDPHQYVHDSDVQDYAREYRKEQMFQNANQAARALRFRGTSPALQVVGNSIATFSTVPMNLIGRGAELTGAGLPLAGLRALTARAGVDVASLGKIAKKIDGKEPTPAQSLAAHRAFRRSISLQAGRGLAGGGLLATGALLRSRGILNSADPQAHEGPSLNIGPNKYDIGKYQPLSTGVAAGGMLVDAHNGHPDNPAGLFAENPYLSTSEQIQGMTTAFDGNSRGLATFIRTVGGFVGPMSPSMLSFIASASDPSGETRKKEAAWDYIYNRVPGLREKLQTSGNVQPSNIKSTGLASLLYPANVTPRGAVPVKRGGGTRKAPSGLGGSGYKGLGRAKL